MASQVNVECLRSLHRILRQRTDLQDRLKRGPKRVMTAQMTQHKFEQDLEHTQALLAETKKKANQKQRQLDERESKIEEIKLKLNACDSNREYQLLNDHIAADRQANSVLADEILELLLRVDEIQIQLDIATENLKKAQAETTTINDKVESELAIVRADLEAVMQELNQAEAKLPPEIKSEYRRMEQSVGENALAPVEENTCGNCCTVLNSQVINELRLSNTVFCKSCGSLLYFGENATI